MLAEDVTINVLLELDTVGEEDICTQELKLSEETCRVPEQDVPDEFVVIEVVSIDSEKVTEIDEETETDVSESEGEVEETVGAVVSKSSVVPEDSPILLEAIPSSLAVICPQVFNNIPRMIYISSVLHMPPTVSSSPLYSTWQYQQGVLIQMGSSVCV